MSSSASRCRPSSSPSCSIIAASPSPVASIHMTGILAAQLADLPDGAVGLVDDVVRPVARDAQQRPWAPAGMRIDPGRVWTWSDWSMRPRCLFFLAERRPLAFFRMLRFLAPTVPCRRCGRSCLASRSRLYFPRPGRPSSWDIRVPCPRPRGHAEPRETWPRGRGHGTDPSAKCGLPGNPERPLGVISGSVRGSRRFNRRGAGRRARLVRPWPGEWV